MLFREIPGQARIKQRLIQSVRENRVSHAQLFLGPEGSGKLAMALAYAQYINCRNRTTEDSCGTCPTCNKFSKLIHPDLHFLYPINKTKELDDKKVTHKDFIITWREFLIENGSYVTLPNWYDKIGIEKKQGMISAEDADSVNHTLAYKAYEAEYKVMIIWMVEKMNNQAANKLLKNLEEPPDKTLFILVSENHDQVISTIISRTQLVKFTKLADNEIFENLKAHFEFPVDSLSNIALQSEGNYTAAKDLVELSLNNAESTDTEKDRFLILRDWMRRIYVYGAKQKEYDSLQEIIAKLVGDGSREKQKEMLAYSLKILRLCMQYHIGNHQLVKYSGEELDFISKFSAFIHPRNIRQIDEEINKAIFHIERNANANIIFTDLSHIIARLIKIPAVAHNKKM
ncbi:MAG: DNA polymerase III subunit delta [Bacteroidetes bacterium]|nr:DNA polymerase III subunit delta [Bacteroidota bacterium]